MQDAGLSNYNMKSYRDLQVYQLAKNLSVKIHKMSIEEKHLSTK